MTGMALMQFGAAVAYAFITTANDKSLGDTGTGK